MIHTILLSARIFLVFIGPKLLCGQLSSTDAHHSLLHHLGNLEHGLLALVTLLLLHLNHLLVQFLLHLCFSILAIGICHSNLCILVKMG